MSYAIYNNGNNRTMETIKDLRNKIYVKLLNNEKDYLKCKSKPNYISHKTVENNLIVIRKSKDAQNFNNPAYI